MTKRKELPVIVPAPREWEIPAEYVEEVIQLADVLAQNKTNRNQYAFWKLIETIIPEAREEHLGLSFVLLGCHLIVKERNTP
jgi:hypothetical protein